MSWTKFDDMFPWNKKIRRLSDQAFRLHTSGLILCSRDGTDGHLTPEDVSDIPRIRRPHKTINELVDRGLWEPEGDGWNLHDYLEYNPSSDEVRAKKAAAAERQRRRRMALIGIPIEPVTSLVTRESRRESRRESQSTSRVSHTTPTRPDPTRPEKSSSHLGNGGGSKQHEDEKAPPTQPCGKPHNPEKDCRACGVARKTAETDIAKATTQRRLDSDRREHERLRLEREAAKTEAATTDPAKIAAIIAEAKVAVKKETPA